MNKIFPRHVLRIALLLLVLTWANSGAAQAVYESQSGSGKVYSDRPISGGKPVELAPLNVVEPVAEPAAAQRSSGSHLKAKAPKTAAEPIYLHFAVTFPEQGGSVATNSAIFDVRVSIDPPLQIARGHAFILRMDGRNVPGRYTATEMTIPAEFFGDMPVAGTQAHVLEVTVIDANGNVLTSAVPVNFQTRFVTVLQRPGFQAGQHPGLPPGQSPILQPSQPIYRPVKPVERWKPGEVPAVMR